MKKHFHPLLAAAIGVCLAVPAFASAPSRSAELKKAQPDQVAKKGGGKKKGSMKKGGAA